MPWSEPKQNWSTDGVRHRYQTKKGFVILAPLRFHRQLRKEVKDLAPHDAPIWFVQNLFVQERDRRKGNGMKLLKQAVKKLPALVGECHLALFRDHVRQPRRTDPAARGCWEKFLEQEGLEVENGFLRLGGDS